MERLFIGFLLFVVLLAFGGSKESPQLICSVDQTVELIKAQNCAVLISENQLVEPSQPIRFSCDEVEIVAEMFNGTADSLHEIV